MAWPSTLPSPLVSGYGLNPVDPVIRTDMEVGTSRARRRSAARQDRIAVSWRFTNAQMAAFRTWFDDPANAAGGANWFTMDVAIGTGGLVNMNCRFVGVWKANALAGLMYEVSATLEVR